MKRKGEKRRGSGSKINSILLVREWVDYGERRFASTAGRVWSRPETHETRLLWAKEEKKGFIKRFFLRYACQVLHPVTTFLKLIRSIIWNKNPLTSSGKTWYRTWVLCTHLLVLPIELLSTGLIKVVIYDSALHTLGQGKFLINPPEDTIFFFKKKTANLVRMVTRETNLTFLLPCNK